MKIRARSIRRPLIVGLSAPQGAGKTTATRKICELAADLGLSAVSISIDDFYLTRNEQNALARKYSENPYLQARGYPLTHDVELGVETLTKLSTLTEDGRRIRIPRYDKSAFGGRGDRRPETEWDSVEGPLDLVILEGWMLGFRRVAKEHLPNVEFEVINDALTTYEKWIRLLDALIWLEPENIRFVVDWRMEAEERMRAEGRPGLPPDQIKKYVETFLIAYETYLPGMKSRLSEFPNALHLKVAFDRSLESARP